MEPKITDLHAERPPMTPEIEAMYEAVSAVNDFVSHYMVSINRAFSSGHSGNYPKAETLPTLFKNVLNDSHWFLRDSANDIGALYHPLKEEQGEVKKVFRKLLDNNISYKTLTRQTEDYHKQTFGPDSTKPAPATMEDIRNNEASPLYYNGIDTLEARLLGELLNNPDRCPFTRNDILQSQKAIKRSSFQTSQLLGEFLEALNELPTITLGKQDDEKITFKNHIFHIPDAATGDVREASVAFILCVARQDSRHSTATIEIPKAFRENAGHYIGRTSQIHKRIYDYLDESALLTQPLIVKQFRNQLDTLCENIAGKAGSYDELIDEMAIFDRKLLNVLGLDQEENYNKARAAFIMREEKRQIAEQQRSQIQAERKKPVMGCPYGHGAQ